MTGNADDEPAAAKGFAFTAGVLVVLFVAAVVTQVLGKDGSGSAGSRPGAATLVWPVTWRFYQNSAHQEFVVAYRFNETSRSFDLVTRPIADAGHRWGLGHSAYGEFHRLLSMAEAVPPSAWRDCAAAHVNACAAIIASAPRPTITGRWASVAGPVVFALERPSGRREGASRRIVRVAVVDLARPR